MAIEFIIVCTTYFALCGMTDMMLRWNGPRLLYGQYNVSATVTYLIGTLAAGGKWQCGLPLSLLGMGLCATWLYLAGEDFDPHHEWGVLVWAWWIVFSLARALAVPALVQIVQHCLPHHPALGFFGLVLGKAAARLLALYYRFDQYDDDTVLLSGIVFCILAAIVLQVKNGRRDFLTRHPSFDRMRAASEHWLVVVIVGAGSLAMSELPLISETEDPHLVSPYCAAIIVGLVTALVVYPGNRFKRRGIWLILATNILGLLGEFQVLSWPFLPGLSAGMNTLIPFGLASLCYRLPGRMAALMLALSEVLAICLTSTSLRDNEPYLRIPGALIAVWLGQIVLRNYRHPSPEVVASPPPLLPTAPPPPQPTESPPQIADTLPIQVCQALETSPGEDGVCVVCMSSRKSHAFLPCGHMCVCGPCGQSVVRSGGTCPVCRGASSQVTQIFS